MENYERFDPTEESSWYGQHSQTSYHLDFLYLFVGEKNLATNSKFSSDYLQELYQRWNIQKKIATEHCNNYPNSWYFPEISGEKFLQLSDKFQWSQFLQMNDCYDHDVFYYLPEAELPKLDIKKNYYIKAPNGFTGRGNHLLPGELALDFIQNKPNQWVIEEYLSRQVDFAITFLSPTHFIIYENHVSPRGQYLGSKIDMDVCSNLEKFFKKIGVKKIESEIFLARWEKTLHWIKQKFSKEMPFRGSFDFFTYLQEGKIQIHPGCEFNPRWTMGRVAWTLANKFFPEAKQLKTTFSADILPGYTVLSPPSEKIKYQICANPD